MTKRNKKLSLTVIAFLVLTALICAVSVQAVALLSSQTGIDDDSTVQEFIRQEHKVGDKVALPAVTVNSEELSPLLYAPDGQVYNVSSIKLDQAGDWKLKYTAQDSTVSEYSFHVYKPMFEINGKYSSATYGNISELTTLYKDTDRSGVYMSVYSGESITINQEIDATSLTKSDTIVSFSLFPQVIGQFDAQTVYIKLVDALDPTNYISISIGCAKTGADDWITYTSYVKASASEQTEKGMEKGVGSFEYEGERYKIHVGGIYGSNISDFSPNGISIYSRNNITADAVGSQSCKVSMDYASKTVYVNGNLIIDLDDLIIQAPDPVWNGFTDSTFKVEVSAVKYKTTSANILVNSVYGMDDMTASVLNKSDSAISFEGYDIGSLSYLVAGMSVDVPVGLVNNGEGGTAQVYPKVYTAYNTGTQTNISLSGNSFTPTEEKDYYFVYKWTDIYGNAQKRVYTIPAVSDSEKVTLSISSAGVATTVKVGEAVNIGLPSIENYIVKYDITVQAKLGDTVVDIAHFDQDCGIYDAEFLPMSVGRWSIVYTCSDLFYKDITAKYTLNVTESDSISFGDAQQVPRFVIKDATYITPFCSAYSFETGVAQLQQTNVYINSTESLTGARLIDGGSFVIDEDWSEVFFIFELNGEFISEKAPVVDLSYGQRTMDISKYFYGAQSTSYESSSGLNITVPEDQDGSYVIKYINPVCAYDFAFGFKIPEDSSIVKLQMKMIDSEDPDNQLVVSFYSVSGYLGFSFNGGTGLVTSSPYNSLAVFSYSYEDRTVSLNDGSSIVSSPIGTLFDEFTNNKIWVEFSAEVEGDGDAKMIVEQINSQHFYNYNSFSEIDETPEISQKDISGDHDFGSVVKIPTLYVGDAFASNITVTLNVTDPSGNAVITVDGITLRDISDVTSVYTIKLDKYGSYCIEYVIKDDLGQKKTYDYYLNVTDFVAPVIIIGEHASTAKVGDKIEVADITVEDNISSSESCVYYVYVKKPDGQYLTNILNSDTEYVYESVGAWRVWFYAIDENGNVGIASYYVNVE